MTSLLHADAFSDAIADSKTSLDIRARYEYVDQAGDNDIYGASIRTRLGFTTGAINGFNASVEFENLSFEDNAERPSLDVPTTEINQLWVSYKNDLAAVKLGNQIYTLDDHRFIGHVGWRQNIQTFDALTAKFSPTAETTLNVAYLDQVNRVNATSQELDGIVLNGAYKVSEELSVTAFAYLLDFDSAGWAKMSTNTYGIRGTGSASGFKYAVSYAIQNDTGDNPNDVSLSYIAAEVSKKLGEVTAALGYESLEGDGTSGFTTPLATVHKFNGFADKFAGKSIGLAGGLPDGLEDLYVKFVYKVPVANGIPVTLFYHKFKAENSGVDFGDEIDAVVAYKLNDYTTLIAKGAYFDAEDGTSNALATFEANLKF